MRAWYQSKTVWVNSFTVAAGTTIALSNVSWISSNPKLSAAILTATGVINILLRFLTNSPIINIFLPEESEPPIIYRHVVELKTHKPYYKKRKR